MLLGNKVWEKARMLNQLPGAHQTYKLATRIVYRNGKVMRLRRGPAAGLRWKHYSCFQPWMAMGLYEPHVAHLISTELTGGDVFYDVGANAGYFSLIAARAVGTSGKVVAFDPNPVNAEAIETQLRLNGLEHSCKVECLAVSGENGTSNFVLTSVNANAHLSHLGAPNLSNEGKSLDVEMITLDHYVRNNRRPTLIKMDIEGAEVDALIGAYSLLRSKNAPMLLVSTHSDDLDRRCKEILQDCNYKFKNLNGFEQMIVAIPPTRNSRSLC